MLDSTKVKDMVKNSGADLCGIASVERFNQAPKGFHPIDIYKDCRSVIVFAKKLPEGPLFASSCVPYTLVSNFFALETDRLGIEISLQLGKLSVRAIPIPSDDPYEHWEPQRSYGRAILSLRHAGYLAGLGILGKNTLLMNEDYGNMVQIGAVLIDSELEGDPIATYEGCPENCKICIDSCPPKALDGVTVDQKLCRPLSCYRAEKSYILKKCNLCRRLCPNCSGIKS
jgi:epoxyqueuosine reductase